MTTEESRESLDRAVEEAWIAYDMHEWERDRWLEKYPTDGEAMWDERRVLLKLSVEAAVSAKARAEERERAEEWAGELCWHRGPHSFSARCNQRRDHLIHDGVCHGCDVVPHEHHGFIPAQATDEYYEERARSSEESGG